VISCAVSGAFACARLLPQLEGTSCHQSIYRCCRLRGAARLAVGVAIDPSGLVSPHRLPSQARRSLPSMVRSHALPRRLIVEAHDLYTDARVRSELDVDAPVDHAGRRAQLAAAVARLHPDDRMQSFENGDVSRRS